MSRAKISKPFSAFSGANFSADINKSEKIRMGSVCKTASLNFTPQASAPGISARGITPNPMRIPRKKAGASFFSTMPALMGTVKLTVQPKMADTRMPPYFPTAGSAARSTAN